MHSLITGGSGFIGSHLAERLLEAGHRVTIVDDLSTGRRTNIAHLLDNPALEDRCRLVASSVRDQALTDRLVSECDQVFHLAAAVGVKLIVERPVHTIETNIHGSEVVLHAAAKYQRKTLLASTSEVYGKSEDVPFREDGDMLYGNTTLSRWSYAASKAIDEFLALAYHREFGLPVVITRFFNTVGPRQSGTYGMVIPRFVEAALTNQPLHVYGDGRQTRCFANVADVVDAMIRLMEEPEAVGQVFNVGSRERVTIRDLAQRIITLSNSRSEIEMIDYHVAYGPGFEDMREREPSLEKIRALIGYEPKRSLDETLREVIEWMRREQAVIATPAPGQSSAGIEGG